MLETLTLWLTEHGEALRAWLLDLAPPSLEPTVAGAPLWWFAALAFSLAVLLLWLLLWLLVKLIALAFRSSPTEAPLPPPAMPEPPDLPTGRPGRANVISLDSAQEERGDLLEQVKPALERRSAEQEADGQVVLSGEERARRDDALAALVAEHSAAATAAAEAIAAGDFEAAVATLKNDAAAATADAADRWRRLGALLRGADVAEARQAYAAAQRLQPDDFWTCIELARLCQDCGDLDAARSATTQAERAATSDDERLVALSEGGDLRAARGDLAGADKRYAAALDLAKRLAAVNPGDAGWQRELSVCHNKVGDLQVDQGDLGAALESYGAALVIRERLVARDPDNDGWLHDLSFSHARVGDVQAALGDRGAALDSYGIALEIAEQLAAAAPDNPMRQAELAERHSRLGRLLGASGRHDQALETLEKGRDLVAPLAERSDTPLWQRYLRTFETDIAALQN